MNNKTILRVLFALTLSIYAGVGIKAQSGRPLLFLETPTDARTAAMGNTTLTKTDRNYLYTNPSSIFDGDTQLTVTATGLYFNLPKSDFITGNLMFASATAGYRFMDRHAVYAGFRYQGGLGIKGGTNDQWGTNKKTSTPFDWAADLGYAFKFNDQLSAFATGSFIQSYTGRAAYAGAFSIGANYRFMLAEDTDLNVAAAVADFGTPIYYSSSEGYSLPTNARLTADFGHAFNDNHKVRAAIGSKYYFLPATAQVFQANLGAEYTLFNIASLRAGYQFGTQETNLWTVGAGVAYYGVKLDFGYISPINKYGSDRLMLTLSFDY
ncbi:MAG: PorV/PorQ family protein [Porphyromonas sp.]|nr:PorV/PorQ family protein [Porphyromonas sp.]